MYKVLKEKGNNQNVTVRNVETKGEVIIGRVSIEIMNKLEEAGIKDINFRDDWDYEVEETIGKDLQKLAMKMKKPIRDQRKERAPKKSNKEIDAMDVLLGLASYN